MFVEMHTIADTWLYIYIFTVMPLHAMTVNELLMFSKGLVDNGQDMFLLIRSDRLDFLSNVVRVY